MQPFLMEFIAKANFRELSREADKVLGAVGTRVNKVQNEIARGSGPAAANPGRALAIEQAFGERALKGLARDGEISGKELRVAVRALRDSFAKLAADLSRRVGADIQPPSQRSVGNEARRLAALEQSLARQAARAADPTRRIAGINERRTGDLRDLAAVAAGANLPRHITSRGQSQAEIERQRAREREARDSYLSSTQGSLDERVAGGRAKRELGQAVRAVDLGIDPKLPRAERDALIALKDRTESLRRSRTAIEQTIGADRRLADAQAEDIAESAKLAIAKRRQTAAANAQAQAILRGRGPAGTEHLALSSAERGTFFQRVQSGVAARSGGGPRLPTEFQTFKQFAESKAITTAGFALSGAVLYGAVSGVKQLVTEAEELEKVLNQVQAQFNSIGQGAEFSDFKKQILEISRDTGQAGSEVAYVAFQMKGAFDTTAEAVKATSSAIKIAKVTGLELVEVVDSLTAASISFGEPIERIGDVALSLQEKTGVLAKETIKALADIAPVAEEVGIGLEQAGALLATAQQSSGRSGAVLAESFGRILPAMSSQGAAIAGLYRDNQKLAGSYDEIIAAVGENNMGRVIERLTKDWDLLTEAQRDQILAGVGSRREAQTLAALLNNETTYVKALGAAYDSTGKLGSYFEKLQETVAQRVDQLKAKFTQLGEALFKAGLADFLKDIVAIGGGAVTILTALAGVLESVLGKFGGLGGKIIAFTLALKALRSLGAIGTRAIERGGVNNIGSFLRRGAVGTDNGLDGFATRAAPGVAASAGRLARTRAAGSGVLALAGGPAGITIGVGLAGLSALENTRREAEKQATEFAEAIKDRTKFSRETLVNLAAQDESLYDFLRAGLTGQTPKSVAAQRELNRISSPAETERLKLLYGRRANIFTGSDDPRISREAIAAQVGTGLDARGGALSGKRAEEQRAAQSLLRRTILNRRGLNPGDVLGGIVSGSAPRSPDATIDSRSVTNEELAELQRQADAGVEGAAALVSAVLAIRTSSADGIKRIADAVASGKRKRTSVQKLKDLEVPEGGGDSKSSLEIDTLVQAVAAGEASVFDLLDRTASELQSIADIAKGGPLPAHILAQRVKFQKIQNEASGANVLALVKANLDNAELTGRGTPEDTIAQYESALPRLKARKDRDAAAAAIRDAERKILDSKLALEEDAAARVKLAEAGVRIPDSSRQVELEANLADLSSTWNSFLETVYGEDLEGAAKATTTLAKALLADAAAGAKTAIALIDQQLADLGPDFSKLKLAAPAAGTPKIAGLGSILGLGKTDPAAAARQKRIDALNAAKAKYTNINPLVTPDGTIPIPAASAGPSPADLVALRKAADEAAKTDALAAAKAQLEFNKVLREFDPVAVANAVIEGAKIEQDLAAKTKEAADDIQAATLRLQGERQLADAMADIFDAQRELAQTVAEIAGDTVGAAQIGADLVAEHLKRTVAKVAAAGGDTKTNAEVQRLEAQLLQANKNVHDVDFQKKVDDIEFAVQLERATVGQEIAVLEGLLSIADPQQTRDLLLKIKGLRDQAGQDLQFNVPEAVRLPTLYEVRRTSEAERRGGGYQDFRTISVTMTNNNATDYQGSIDRFTDIIDRAPRVYGSSERAY